MYRTGAVGALLDIYEQEIAVLKKLVAGIPNKALLVITDAQTTDESCRSVQAILTHVVHSGHGYANLIHQWKGNGGERPPKKIYFTIQEYLTGLDGVFAFTEKVFQNITDDELEQLDDSLKIKTGWNQLYDIEQLMEHAITHVMRHKRQIERIIHNGLI
jgi:uncharacterized damage-inducible protein DinB